MQDNWAGHSSHVKELLKEICYSSKDTSASVSEEMEWNDENHSDVLYP